MYNYQDEIELGFSQLLDSRESENFYGDFTGFLRKIYQAGFYDGVICGLQKAVTSKDI